MKNPFHMVLRFLLFPLARIIVPCRVMDKDKYSAPDRGQLVVSNHLSWMDVAYELFWIPGYKRTLSKKENEGGKLKHWFLKKVGILFINREKPELSSMRECINAIMDGDTLCVFPEGTRNRVNRDIQNMHSGAAMFALRSKGSVIPIVVHHKGKLCKRNYLGVGDRIDLTDLYEKRLDESILTEATERFRRGMQKTLDKLDVWVDTKGWKRERRERKRVKKQLKLDYKLAKKQAKAAAKK